MEHYSAEAWRDFLQGVTSDELSAAMREHLRSGCQKCLSIERALVRRLVDHPKMRASPAPPERRASDVFDAILCGEVPRFARKVFDSVLQPSPSGFRESSHPAASKVHQLLYDAAPYLLDLRLDLERSPLHLLLTGQLVRSSGHPRSLQGLAVALIHGRDALLQTATNRFGEFQIEYQAGQDLVLGVQVGRQEVVCVALPDVPRPGGQSAVLIPFPR